MMVSKLLRRYVALVLLMPALILTQVACAESSETVSPPAASAKAAAASNVVASAKASAVKTVATVSTTAERVLDTPAKANINFEAGTHYKILPTPARTSDPSKIEVMEVFWYGCGHCYTFEPLVTAWKKGIADDVLFARTPAVWAPIMRTHASLYYTAEALNLPESIHSDIFALLAPNPRLNDQDKFAAVFAKYGVSEEKYTKAFNAFGTTSKVSQGETRAKKNYLIEGTPEIIVNGKYRISGQMAGGQAGMLQVVNYLIELERKSL